MSHSVRDNMGTAVQKPCGPFQLQALKTSQPGGRLQCLFLMFTVSVEHEVSGRLGSHSGNSTHSIEPASWQSSLGWLAWDASRMQNLICPKAWCLTHVGNLESMPNGNSLLVCFFAYDSYCKFWMGLSFIRQYGLSCKVWCSWHLFGRHI